MSLQPTINKPQERESNIELLRIILMLMIIGYHLLVHGGNVGPLDGDYYITSDSSVAYLLLKSFLVISVNSFVFLSGYYRINFKIKPFLSLIFQTIFYSLTIHLVVDALTSQQVSTLDYLTALFPFFLNSWWYITAYLALYLLSPLLNSAIDAFTKNQFLFVVISMTAINLVGGFSESVGEIVGNNKGHSLINFIHIYLIAQYIRKYEHLDNLTKHSSAVYFGTSLLVFVLAFLSITQLDQLGVKRIFAYNNPLVLLAAISFFFIFKNINIRSKIINNISPYVLGVYLFHDHPLTREHLIEYLFDISQSSSAFLHFLNLLLITLLIFLAGFIIDKIRSLLLTPIILYLIERFRLERVERIFKMRPR